MKTAFLGESPERDDKEVCGPSRYPGLAPDHSKSMHFDGMPHYAAEPKDFIRLQFQAELNVKPGVHRRAAEKEFKVQAVLPFSLTGRE